MGLDIGTGMGQAMSELTGPVWPVLQPRSEERYPADAPLALISKRVQLFSFGEPFRSRYRGFKLACLRRKTQLKDFHRAG